MSWKSTFGLLRSWLMYYGKPFNQRRLRRFYSRFIKSGDLCFDIGAHLGNRSKSWLSLQAKVIAVEPQPVCIDFLKRKFSSEPDFILVEKAVGSKPGKAMLHISEKTPTVSSLANQQWRDQLNQTSNVTIDWNKQVEVEVITLDQLIQQYGIPAFCKIDVEDFELEVLKGLSQPIQTLSFEFFNWTPAQTQACLNRLDQLANYSYNWSIGESQRWQSNQQLSSGQLLKEISAYRKKRNFSGDIYAFLKNGK